MGADLIGTVLVIDKDKEPDWAAAEKWAENLTADELLGEQISDAFENTIPCDDEVSPENIEALSDEELKFCADERRERLLFCIKETKSAFDEYWRNTMYFYVRGAKVFVLAETSWGDSPEGLEELTLFELSGASKAAGFENE